MTGFDLLVTATMLCLGLFCLGIAFDFYRWVGRRRQRPMAANHR